MEVDGIGRRTAVRRRATSLAEGPRAARGNDISAVDWTAPWLAPIAELGRRVVSAADWRAELERSATATGITTARGRPLRFVEPDAAGASPYEVHIAATGEVPTRANLHDLFNALAWLAMPRFKARLNELQAAAIESDGIGARRSALRDAATLLDENSLLLVSERIDLVEQLRRHDWHALLVDARDAWPDQIHPRAFGHALLEKLVRPYKAISAHGLHVPLPAGSDRGAIDAWLAEALTPELTARDLLPLPVLGVPGWWAGNAEPRFYDDEAVFRPARGRRVAILRKPETRQ